MFDNMPLIMARCLILTIVIELIFAIILGIRDKKDILNVILVQVLTNPIVVTIPYLIYIEFGYIPYKVSIYILEVLAVLIEGFVYSKTLKYKKINPYLFSFLLNLFSYSLGLVINKFL
jgi:hypothetical protein